MTVNLKSQTISISFSTNELKKLLLVFNEAVIFFFIFSNLFSLCQEEYRGCRCVIPMMRFIRKKEEHLKLMGSRKTWNFSKTTAFYLTRRIRLMPFSYRQSILDDISHSGREHREMWRREIPPHVHLNLCVQLWRC